MGDQRISKATIYFCDQEARKELKPLFLAARQAQEQGNPGMIIAQVHPDRTGDGVFLDAHYLPYDQGVKLNAFIKEALLAEVEQQELVTGNVGAGGTP